MSLAAQSYLAGIIAAGTCCVAAALFTSSFPQPAAYICCLGLALLASQWKVQVPGGRGSVSVTFFFVLLAMMEFNYPETVILACLATTLQNGVRAERYLLHASFNCTSMAVAASGGYWVYRFLERSGDWRSEAIIAAASTFFALNSLSVAGAVCLTGSKKFYSTWKESYAWSFPIYLVGAVFAIVVNWSNARFGWETSLLALPVIFFIYRSYRLYLGKLEAERSHAEQMAALHLRTIEALALAIEAKDDITRQHLRRVQVYAAALGQQVGLSEIELQALRAASILHDIGKLAVPEHIISKPGKLTPEEFEKMKIHPVVGAEILSRVEFPYPVALIVRAHHEKWDGTGYPDGLKGEAIPIGARILAVVDCLDALASDRQYRRALPLDEAMAGVAAEAGRSYDPNLVATLRNHYQEWEKLALANGSEHSPSLRDVRVTRGNAPAAGLENAGPDGAKERPEFLASIAAARQEAQVFYELTRDLGTSLNLHETLSVLDSRLKRLIPYDAMAVYIKKGDSLAPVYVSGENFRLFASLEIPIGQGLSGWVAETGKPIVNGNPSVEPGYLNDPGKFSNLRSALAVPLENSSGITGVLALYHAARDAFHQDHLRVLLAIDPKVSLAVENALKYEQAEISATTDALTGLANARSLFLHLDAELARARRASGKVAVVVCDLDGFKQVNDRFGHLEGNKVLKLVAAGLEQNCREYDYVARMGGDEFVMVLSSLPREILAETLDRLGKAAQEAGMEVCGEPLLSLSAGAAFFPEDGNDAESLLAEADRRMYVAKQVNRARAGDSSSASLAALDSALRPEAPKAVS